MTGRYISPFTDFGFKRLFGEEPNKDLLIDFLNELLRKEQGEIKSLTYIKSEQLGNSTIDRKAVFDLYCENERGERFIVELQKAKQNFFKERTVFYSTFPIQHQAPQGDWNFNLKAVYTIGILDFIFKETADDPEVVHREPYRHVVKLVEVHSQEIFYDKLTYIYLELPKFKKTEEELETKFDKWLYVLKNLGNLSERPAKLQERIFEKLFGQAEVAAFSQADRLAYESSLKYYRDLNNVVDTAEQKGRMLGLQEGLEAGRQAGLQEGLERGHQAGLKEGIEQGKQLARDAVMRELAQKLKATGMTDEQISATLGLPLSEVKRLL
jgi:predicted transposase/invertase (TIGR01784 family)